MSPGTASGKLPALRGKDIIHALHRAGFQTLRSRGSHEMLYHPDGRRLTIAVHPTAEIGRPIIKKIIRDAGLSDAEFLGYL